MSNGVAVPVDFDPVPSLARTARAEIEVGVEVPAAADAVGHLLAEDAEVPDGLGVDRAGLTAAGFTGAAGQVLVVPRSGTAPVVVAGVGAAADLDVARIRDAAGSLARSAGTAAHLAVVVPATSADAGAVGQALVEGVLLARYAYDALRTGPAPTALATLTLVAPANQTTALAAGAARGRATATAGQIARDLANTPPAHLTAVAMAEVAERLAAEVGLTVEVFDKEQLVELGCGGLLGVNAGSVDPPRMIKLSYRPADADAHVTLVGKGIMYDSGGISLKPADGTHATMKNDMSGAGAVLAAMWALPALGCSTAVTGYLMCTDNMPSGTALKMGDVITMRGGTTVEITNTDAEGRLVMGDALALATEEPTDAIIDIATLTGASLRALGPEVATVMGNHQGVIDQIRAAAEATDEPVWQLPLERRYRKYLDTPIADLRNLGGEHAGAITAALFLAEFVGDRPWAHIDIAGTAQADAADAWRAAGCTGFGARLLVELLLDFTKPTDGGDR